MWKPGSSATRILTSLGDLPDIRRVLDPPELELRRVSVPLKRRALRLGERVLLVLSAPPFVLSAPRLQTRSESSNVALAAFAAAATGGTRESAT